MEAPVKKRVDLELEVTTNNIGENPYHKWIHLAKTVDAWRIFPRAFVSVYIYLLYEVETTKAITKLSRKIREDTNMPAHEAMQYSQAALNLAHVLATLNNIE